MILRSDLWRHRVFQASQASATDLRLWCSYVQLLALLDCREEAIKVAEKALSMVQVRLRIRLLPPSDRCRTCVSGDTVLRLPTVVTWYDTRF